MSPFKAKILDVLIITITCLLLYLGYWQLDRSKQKQYLINRIHNVSEKASDVKLFEADSLPLYEHISCEANINLGTAILLDNQFHDHEHGFRAMAIAKCKGSNKILLVDRGWVSKEKAKDIIENKKYRGIIKGISIWPSSGILLKKQDIPKSHVWPLILQKLDINIIEMALNNQIFPAAIRLPPEHELSLTVPEIKISTSPQKHKGYAIQWFSLAIVLMIYYSVNRRKVTKNGAR